MNILIVDDEPHVRRSMAQMIHRVLPQYGVEEAQDGEDAIHMLEQKRFDLVITDLRMPAVNGLELSKHIHERWTNTPVVMLTGYAEFQYAQSALRYGVKEYLLKPASAEQISEVITRVTAASSSLKQIEEVDKHRRQLLLEKRVQDLFYELPLPYYDESLFSPFKNIALYSFAAATPAQLERTARFAIKNVAEDVLQPYGSPVVIVGDQATTAVLFVGEDIQVHEDDLRHLAAKVVQMTEQTIRIKLHSSFGGTTADLKGLSALYEKSLQPLSGLSGGVSGESSDHSDEAAVHRHTGGSHHEQMHHIVREALAIIRERYAEDMTLTSLAAELYVSPNYLSSLFKAETGSTFTHHLTAVRMERAKQLLATTNQKIYQICEKVGYGDQAHFSRMFKTLEGMSPYEYRSKANF